jgi:hypothetical protein
MKLLIMLFSPVSYHFIPFEPNILLSTLFRMYGQVGFVVDKVALGRVFSEYFGFPRQSSFHQIFHHNHPGQVQ